jgi:hypothetical protein
MPPGFARIPLDDPKDGRHRARLARKDDSCCCCAILLVVTACVSCALGTLTLFVFVITLMDQPTAGMPPAAPTLDLLTLDRSSPIRDPSHRLPFPSPPPTRSPIPPMEHPDLPPPPPSPIPPPTISPNLPPPPLMSPLPPLPSPSPPPPPPLLTAAPSPQALEPKAITAPSAQQPLTPEALVQSLNARFRDGAPNNDLVAAGVLMRIFEGMAGRHSFAWEPCADDEFCARSSDRLASSIVNARMPHLYRHVRRAGTPPRLPACLTAEQRTAVPRQLGHRRCGHLTTSCARFLFISWRVRARDNDRRSPPPVRPLAS